MTPEKQNEAAPRFACKRLLGWRNRCGKKKEKKVVINNPKMKIYIVTSGCYSDREVVAAYTTLKLAESAKKICDEDGDIIPMELDQMPAHEPGTKLYRLYMMRNGDMKQQPFAISAFGESEEVVEWTWETEEAKKGWTFKVWARDEAHAVKIAGEKRAMLIAQPNDQALRCGAKGKI